MLMEAEDLAAYYTVSETARCLGLPEAHVRDWQLKKLIAPALSKGRIQFARHDVARMFALDRFQATFGPVAIATVIAQALQPADLEALLDGERSEIRARVCSPDGDERTYVVQLGRVALQQLRERMAEVSR
jgi:DNA-binding transcriptional MerR regulator